MQIDYRINNTPGAAQVIELYNNAGLPRPTDDAARIAEMYENSNIVVTAWHNDLLVGAARGITDFVWSCYLADLAVRDDYMGLGIGRKLVALTRETLGKQVMIVLLSVPSAIDYYPRLGFEQVDYGFILKREQ